jgi:hypothetical protein
MEKRLLVMNIGQLFASITNAAKLNEIPKLNSENTISLELWHGESSWKIFDFYFDGQNNLISIESN